MISIFCELNFATICNHHRSGRATVVNIVVPYCAMKNISEEESSVYTSRRKKFRMYTLPVESEYDYRYFL
jgi:hypothetical protein